MNLPATQTFTAQDNLQVAAVKPTDLREAMRLDLDTMAAVCAPDVYFSPMSPMHHSIWVLITNVLLTPTRLTKHAIGIPRGHAKTHTLKLLILYIIFFTDLSYVLVIGNTVSLARSVIEDVMTMLGSDNIRALFGDYRLGIDKDNAEVKEFNFLGRDLILKPFGAGSSVRGTNINNRRPQVIICDDMQSADEAKSIEQSKQLMTWFLGTLLKARDYHRCHVIYVGNMYPDLVTSEKGATPVTYACILRNLQLAHDWVSWVTGAFLADGSSIWPAVHPPEALLEDLASDTNLGNAHVWYAEVQNDPRASEGMFFNITKAAPWTPVMPMLPIGKFIMIDPSLGKKTSDNQVVGLFEIYDETGPVWKELRVMQMKAPQLVPAVLQWAMEENVPAIFGEAYGYQESLLHWFEYFMQIFNIPTHAIKLVPISRAGGNQKAKNVWIYESFGSVYAQVLKMVPKVFAAYTTEALAFNPLQTDNVDDILDNGEYAIRIFHEKRDLVIVNNVLRETFGNYEPHKEFDHRTYDYRTGE